ncbi:MAG: hypothetical protein ACFFDN_14980 [Candidatus Hodarchaeota archaeon]
MSKKLENSNKNELFRLRENLTKFKKDFSEKIDYWLEKVENKIDKVMGIKKEEFLLSPYY